MRLMRFLPVARGSILRETTKPSRDGSISPAPSSLSLARTLKNLSDEMTGFLKTRLY